MKGKNNVSPVVQNLDEVFWVLVIFTLLNLIGWFADHFHIVLEVP